MILISNTVGVIIIYSQIKNYHKKVIRTLISKNSFDQVIEQLVFSKEALINGEYELKFLEPHEFRYNGKMYDIISSWETEDSIFYKCINDSKEESIENAFIEFVVNNSHRQDLPLPIKHLISFLNIEVFNITTKQNFYFNEIHFYKNDFDEKILINYTEIPTPPPRIPII